MTKDKKPVAIDSNDVPVRVKPSVYPEPFASQMEGREKQQLGEFFGLQNFGVNLTRLKPKAVSALRHAHSTQDELMYILEGHPTLYTEGGPVQLSPSMCSGFRAGEGNANHLVNETDTDVVFLEIGDRSPGDDVVYPDDDLKALLVDGSWKFFHKDGTPY